MKEPNKDRDRKMETDGTKWLCVMELRQRNGTKRNEVKGRERNGIV